MNDDMDIEKTLKRYRSDPGLRVKQAVMNRYDEMHGGRLPGADVGRTAERTGRWWKRPVPLYAFAAGMIVAVGLSFFAGRTTIPSHNPPDAAMEAAPALYEGDLEDIQWRTAPNDVL